MDVLLINDISFSNSVKNPQMGQLILKKILSEKYVVDYINFDYLNMKGILEYEDDANKTLATCGDYILSYSPRIVAFYTICSSFIYTVQIAEYIKQRCPNIKVVFGGPHASLVARECLEVFEFLDVVSVGEGELTIMPLVDALLGSKELTNVKNIVYRKNKNIIFSEKERQLTNEELSKYTIYDFIPFNIEKSKQWIMEGGRGCPYACTFCSTSLFWGRKYRIKPINILVEEMEKINTLYGIRDFHIIHDMFTADREKLAKFCDTLITKGLQFKWTCSARMDSLNKNLLDKMKLSGCYDIYVGIETGSQVMQKIINKNLDLDSTLNLIKYMVKIGYNITTSFIYCFPEERVRDFEDTISMMESMIIMGVNTIQLHRFMPLPSTIELERCHDILYFDENQVDISIFHKKYITEKSISLIEKYPILFSQYYTLASEINDIYPRYDFFIMMLDNVKHFFGNTIRLVVNKTGINKIYKGFRPNIEKWFHDFECQTLYKEDFDGEYIQSICEYFIMWFETKYIDILSFYEKEIYKFDKEKYLFANNNTELETKIISVNVNIEEFVSSLKVIPKRNYVKLWKRGDIVYISKLSDLYTLLKENINYMQ